MKLTQQMTMNKTIMYLTRHGQTEENAAHVLQGWMPGHLSAEGIKQVESLRDELKEVRFDAVVCSDLKRCVDSATILSEPHGLTPQPTQLLRERDWGSLTGKNILDQIVNLKVEHWPADVESEPAIYQRALKFLEYVQRHYAGKTILAVGHGMIDRYVQAVWKGVDIHQIPRMGTAEVRKLEIPVSKVYTLPAGVAQEKGEVDEA